MKILTRLSHPYIVRFFKFMSETRQITEDGEVRHYGIQMCKFFFQNLNVHVFFSASLELVWLDPTVVHWVEVD